MEKRHKFKDLVFCVVYVQYQYSQFCVSIGTHFYAEKWCKNLKLFGESFKRGDHMDHTTDVFVSESE